MMAFPGVTSGKQSAYQNRGGKIPWVEKIPGVENGTQIQYSCWKMPWPEGPGGLLSMGLQKFGRD